LPEIAGHVHVHDGRKLLLQWFDFPCEPFLISKDVSEERVRDFCQELGTEYRENAPRS